jgi:hypothetical protein
MQESGSGEVVATGLAQFWGLYLFGVEIEEID